MKKKEKLTKTERDEIEILINKGYSFRSIAKVLGRSPNTISYEVKTNGGRKGYRAKNANQYARTRLKDRRFQWSNIEHMPELKAYIINKLEKHWNPDEISGRMKYDQTWFYASKTAIYDWLRSVYGQRYCAYLYSRRYNRKRRKIKTQKVMIPDRTSIDERYLGANNRTRYGHWEADTVVSGKKTGSKAVLSVVCERKTRFVAVKKIKNLRPKSHTIALKNMLRNKKVLSLTQDNGIENKWHQKLGLPTFFCNPYSSWQKGSVENINKMIRRYFPKGIDFRTVAQREINRIVSLINKKPRKILGYRSALEVARANGVI